MIVGCLAEDYLAGLQYISPFLFKGIQMFCGVLEWHLAHHLLVLGFIKLLQ